MQMSGEGLRGLGVLKSGVTARAEAVRDGGQAALGFIQCGSKEICVLHVVCVTVAAGQTA